METYGVALGRLCGQSGMSVLHVQC
jgi:hypothetical protein